MGPALQTGVDCAPHAVHACPGRPELTHRCAPLVRGLVRIGPPAPQASCEPTGEPSELDEQFTMMSSTMTNQLLGKITLISLEHGNLTVLQP